MAQYLFLPNILINILTSGGSNEGRAPNASFEFQFSSLSCSFQEKNGHNIRLAKPPLGLFFFFKFLEDMSPFCGTTDTPVLDF